MNKNMQNIIFVSFIIFTNLIFSNESSIKSQKLKIVEFKSEDQQIKIIKSLHRKYLEKIACSVFYKFSNSNLEWRENFFKNFENIAAIIDYLDDENIEFINWQDKYDSEATEVSLKKSKELEELILINEKLIDAYHNLKAIQDLDLIDEKYRL